MVVQIANDRLRAEITFTRVHGGDETKKTHGCAARERDTRDPPPSPARDSASKTASQPAPTRHRRAIRFDDPTSPHTQATRRDARRRRRRRRWLFSGATGSAHRGGKPYAAHPDAILGPSPTANYDPIVDPPPPPPPPHPGEVGRWVTERALARSLIVAARTLGDERAAVGLVDERDEVDRELPAILPVVDALAVIAVDQLRRRRDGPRAPRPSSVAPSGGGRQRGTQPR